MWGCVNGVSVRGLGSKHSDEKKDKSISKIRVCSKNDNSSNNKHHRDDMDRVYPKIDPFQTYMSSKNIAKLLLLRQVITRCKYLFYILQDADGNV